MTASVESTARRPDARDELKVCKGRVGQKDQRRREVATQQILKQVKPYSNISTWKYVILSETAYERLITYLFSLFEKF